FGSAERLVVNAEIGYFSAKVRIIRRICIKRFANKAADAPSRIDIRQGNAIRRAYGRLDSVNVQSQRTIRSRHYGSNELPAVRCKRSGSRGAFIPPTVRGDAE